MRVFFNAQHVASDSGSPEPHFFHQTTHHNPFNFGGPSISVPVPQADAGPPREDLHQENIDRITTHQIIDEKLPGYFESPLPEAFSEVNATRHRWIVEVSIVENPIPRHPALGARFVTGHNVQEARASMDGLAYQCPGALVMGDDLELQMLRVEIAVPSAETIFRLVLQHAGYSQSSQTKAALQAKRHSRWEVWIVLLRLCATRRRLLS